jgi:hypothetical protein
MIGNQQKSTPVAQAATISYCQLLLLQLPAAPIQCTFWTWGVTRTATQHMFVRGGWRTAEGSAAALQLLRLARTAVGSRLLGEIRAQEEGMHAAGSVRTSELVDVSNYGCTLLLLPGQQLPNFERAGVFKI